MNNNDNKVRLYEKPFWDEKYEEVLKLFFRTFKYGEKEIDDLIDDIKETEFPEIKKFIYYLIEILITMNDFCGVEFDNIEIALDCKYANILKFSCSSHDKVRYNFISKIQRKNIISKIEKSNEILYAEENAAYVNNNEECDDEFESI